MHRIFQEFLKGRGEVDRKACSNVRDHEHILKQYYMELLWKIVKYVYSDMVTWTKFEEGVHGRQL